MDEEYDVIVLGTGLTVSKPPLAGACSCGRPNPASVPRHSRKDEGEMRPERGRDGKRPSVHSIHNPTIVWEVSGRRWRPGRWCRCCVTPCSIF